ncbi:OLC1v1028963C1 [Oldenlandia corymbosa var. corymbosa]|uniref:OLC1v1028963C1 n=1 Tax=Oldenlandia corymbosa var. corymbosa TaxID=529605 RepID=A0AAV1CCY3_OLDCO|nr:OLC1v1028963C1 [Oldenlandia corymbosa var. corymbosa]
MMRLPPLLVPGGGGGKSKKKNLVIDDDEYHPTATEVLEEEKPASAGAKKKAKKGNSKKVGSNKDDDNVDGPLEPKDEDDDGCKNKPSKPKNGAGKSLFSSLVFDVIGDEDDDGAGGDSVSGKQSDEDDDDDDEPVIEFSGKKKPSLSGKKGGGKGLIASTFDLLVEGESEDEDHEGIASITFTGKKKKSSKSSKQSHVNSFSAAFLDEETDEDISVVTFSGKKSSKKKSNNAVTPPVAEPGNDMSQVDEFDQPSVCASAKQIPEVVAETSKNKKKKKKKSGRTAQEEDDDLDKILAELGEVTTPSKPSQCPIPPALSGQTHEEPDDVGGEKEAEEGSVVESAAAKKKKEKDKDKKTVAAAATSVKEKPPEETKNDTKAKVPDKEEEEKLKKEEEERLKQEEAERMEKEKKRLKKEKEKEKLKEKKLIEEARILEEKRKKLIGYVELRLPTTGDVREATTKRPVYKRKKPKATAQVNGAAVMKDGESEEIKMTTELDSIETERAQEVDVFEVSKPEVVDVVEENKEVKSVQHGASVPLAAKPGEIVDKSKCRGVAVKKEALKPDTFPIQVKKEATKPDAPPIQAEKNLRSLICCIMGHVDTGKTELLDCIRGTNVQEGEAGGITQQIGATYFPAENIRDRTKELKADAKLNVPGLLVIDTPGHESFANLRSHGSGLCDIAILVVDIMHGLQPQTIKSLHLLRKRNTEFIIALNEVDRIYEWKPHRNSPIRKTIKLQSKVVQNQFNRKLTEIITQFKEQGINTELYYKNKEMGETFSMVPTSATTVKVIEGHGTTIDVVLVNGVLHEGGQVVVCGMNGPIVTTVRALLTPHPMKELRVKGTYLHHKEIKAAQGIKIAAQGLEQAIAGTGLYVVGPDDNLDDIKESAIEDMGSVMKRIDISGEGVYAQASTLGSLEALLEFLKTPAVNIPVSGIAKIGTPLCVPAKDFIDIGRIASIRRCLKGISRLMMSWLAISLGGQLMHSKPTTRTIYLTRSGRWWPSSNGCSRYS